jgi:uncharacterized protein (TIGR02680 family)
MKTNAKPVPERARWTLLRAGLQNIWEYDSQVFVCHKGRLLLRGRNESGKTKALEVLFPFLLDADLSPQRIDPFGSTARQMRFNLINEGNPDIGVSIGYLWMEFGRRKGDVEEYFTIGAGLRAMRSNTDLTAWFFTTSCRVGVDFNLLADTREPLTRKALEETLSGRGNVWEKRSDYRHAVQRTLFGLSEDQYAALVDTLIRLRRPQLSSKLELIQLSELLTASLPPLEENVIRPIAEGFERLDLHRAERDAAERNLMEVQRFEKTYRDYLRAESKASAQALTTAESAFHKAREALKDATARRDAAERRQEELDREIRELQRAESELGGRLEALRSSEEYKAVEALARAEAEVGAQEGRARRAAESEEEERGSYERHEARHREAAGTLASRKEEADRERGSAAAAARLAQLETEHGVLGDRSSKGAVEAITKKRQEDIAAVEKEGGKVVQAEGEAKIRREMLGQAEGELTEALKRAEAARTSEASVRREYSEKVVAWRSGARILGLVTDLESALADDNLQRIPSLVYAAAELRRVELGRLLEEAAAALRRTEEEVARLLEEKERLAREPHRPPAPVWRAPREAGRSGAPFYMLCEFSTQDAAVQAGLEAALESAGILDAWVTAEGMLLDPKTQDVVFDVGPSDGRTLLEYLKPARRDGVPEVHVERILKTVRVALEGEAGDGSCWVSTDGRWANGVLHGAWIKAAPAYIGESARERERERRRAEVEKLLADGERERAQAAGWRDAIRNDSTTLEAEVRALPQLSEVERWANWRAAAEEEAGRKRVLRDEETRRTAAAEKKLSETKARRDAAAVERRLTAWIDRLQELHALVSLYREAALEAIRAGEKETEARLALARTEQDRAEGERRLEARLREVEETTRELERLRAWARGLRETAGATSDAVVREARELEEKIQTSRKDIARVRSELRSTDEATGVTKNAVMEAERMAAEEDGRRKAAEASFRDFALEGLLEAAGLKPTSPASEWSSRDALVEARRVDAETNGVDVDRKAREALQNRLLDKHHDLQLALPPEIKVTPSLEKSIWRYPSRLNGRPLMPAELVESLRRDVEARERRLGEDERALLESFLSGEARQHLQDRLRGAHDLVDAMNQQIEGCPTASGTRVRLKWEVGADAAPGTRKAIDLLLKNADLLTEADRKSLKDFLQDRLEHARTAAEEPRSLMLRMSDILDYRRWHTFTIMHKEGESDWKPLTKKSHAAGSGGKKAMILHLPLFAAAAAFYGSASQGSARVIALDEAFAGIDKQARGELMGLLKALDLDFVMTSHEEWGFYEELDGLSTYHLTRDPGCRGVLAERFIWDGRVAERVEE